jgi:hypothetical protein
VRRIVATVLVVASSLLIAVPVGAEPRPVGPANLPAAPAVIQAPATPVPLTVPPSAAPAVTMVQTPVVAAPSATPVPVHRAVRAIRAKAPDAAELGDAVYAARLQAELCRARQIFCGLDHGGRYLVR